MKFHKKSEIFNVFIAEGHVWRIIGVETNAKIVQKVDRGFFIDLISISWSNFAFELNLSKIFHE